MDAKMAQSVFGKPPATAKRSSKEGDQFKNTNDSLVKKMLLYKQQLAERSKIIEKLRAENLELRQRNHDLTNVSDDRKIELIVEQRVQKRLSHAAVLNKKLVQILQQTGSEMEGLFEGIETNQSELNSRRMPKTKISLDRVDESPVRRIPRFDQNDDDTENMNQELNEGPTSSSVQNLERGTPKQRINHGRGRRSELFQNLDSLPVDETITEDKIPVDTVSRRAPMLIAPATPSAAPPTKKAPVSARRRKIVDVFKKPATPAPIGPAEESEVTDTFQVRRQRSAKMNIKTLKEPSLGGKLRRPGKHDEPMPYIDTFF